MQNGVSTVTLAALIQAALTRDLNYNHQRFGDAVEAYAGRMCRARAPDLVANDLIEDVAHEAVVQLFVFGSGALANTPALKLLRHAVLAAIRKVRADHGPPGQRTRRYREEPRDRIAAEDVDRIPDREALAAATVTEGDQSYVDFDALPCPQAAHATAAAEQRMAIDTALAKMPLGVARALRLIHLDEKPMAEAAELLGLSRFALHRRIEQHCAVFRLAA